MLSGRGPILMRMRISFDALRLCLLVAAGVTSGYLWRAAFESSSPVDSNVASRPHAVAEPAAPRIVVIPSTRTGTARRKDDAVVLRRVAVTRGSLRSTVR